MEIRDINDNYSATGQIQPEHVADLKEMGFKSIICNRPDDEEIGQPSASTIEKAAREAGLAFRHIPFTGAQMDQGHVEAMAKALDEMEGPVLAYCRSGARSTNIHAAVCEKNGG
ncbi:TIGR01244 family sulfur transferase [Limoniibacter endophyticus]|uniref:Oxidoreductase n=1 Tax=Limoniibacter endophyticus TaxID=1565040 RepID=A0A8J3DHR2_9HYPH|nr:TIGR01244 family sulfur transferase [Limoniibacter endophyticus]GHC67939.1 oxidoreductase [Limoniibacter endophyticus]